MLLAKIRGNSSVFRNLLLTNCVRNTGQIVFQTPDFSRRIWAFFPVVEIYLFLVQKQAAEHSIEFII